MSTNEKIDYQESIFPIAVFGSLGKYLKYKSLVHDMEI